MLFVLGYFFVTLVTALLDWRSVGTGGCIYDTYSAQCCSTTTCTGLNACPPCSGICSCTCKNGYTGLTQTTGNWRCYPNCGISTTLNSVTNTCTCKPGHLSYPAWFDGT